MYNFEILKLRKQLYARQHPDLELVLGGADGQTVLRVDADTSTDALELVAEEKPVRFCVLHRHTHYTRLPTSIGIDSVGFRSF